VLAVRRGWDQHINQVEGTSLRYETWERDPLKAPAGHPPSENPTADEKTLLERLGPGLITGASDDDPSGIATYSQAGVPIMVVVMLMVGNPKVMGRFSLKSGGLRALGWLATGVMFAASVGMFVTLKR